MMLEKKYHEWLAIGGGQPTEQFVQFEVDALHLIDFNTMTMIHRTDPKDVREISRGAQGVRDVRPSPEKFLDNTAF